MRATVANAGGVQRLGRWSEPRRLDDEPSSVFHGLSTGAIPSNMKAAVGRRWKTRAGPLPPLHAASAVERIRRNNSARAALSARAAWRSESA